MEKNNYLLASGREIAIGKILTTLKEKTTTMKIEQETIGQEANSIEG